MLRTTRLVMMVLIAMFIVTVPTAVAQSPVADQYAVAGETGAGPADEAAAGGGDAAGAGKAAAGGGDSGAAPVQVRTLTETQADALPFTGGQISLIALIGLALLATGVGVHASTRRRAGASVT